MIRFAGPAFAGIDNRLMALQLVERGLTDAAMFTATGDVVQPSEVLHGKPILVERGSFRPATKLTLDLLERARQQFVEEDRKSTRLNSSHSQISYAVFCLKKKKNKQKNIST